MKTAWVSLVVSVFAALSVVTGLPREAAAQTDPTHSTRSPVEGETLRQFLARAGIQGSIGPGEKVFGISLDRPVDARMDMSRRNPDPDMLRVQLTDGKVVGIYLPTGRMVSFTQLFGFGDPDDGKSNDGFEGAVPKEKALEIVQGILKEMGVDLPVSIEDVREYGSGGPHWQILKPLTYQGIPTDSLVRVVLVAKSGRVRAFSAIPFEYSGPTAPAITKEQAVAAAIAFEPGKGMASEDATQYDAELRISRPNNKWTRSTEEKSQSTGGYVLCWNVRHRDTSRDGVTRTQSGQKASQAAGCRHDTLFLVDAQTGKVCGGMAL